MIGLEERIERILKPLSLVEKDWGQWRSVQELASLAHWSPSVFHAHFVALYEESPQSYLRKRRLSLISEELLHTGQSIAHLAWAYGYETPEAMTKAFVKQFACSPTQYRERKEVLWYSQVPVLTQERLWFLNGSAFEKKPILVNRPSSGIQGIHGLIGYEEVGLLIEKIHQQQPELESLLVYGRTTPEWIIARKAYFVVGGEVSSVQGDFDLVELPDCPYWQFAKCGDVQSYTFASDFIWNQWLQKNTELKDPLFSLNRLYLKEGRIINQDMFFPVVG